MNTDIANDLIEQLWDMEEKLKALQTALTAAEYMIADTIADRN